MWSQTLGKGLYGPHLIQSSLGSATGTPTLQNRNPGMGKETRAPTQPCPKPGLRACPQEGNEMSPQGMCPPLQFMFIPEEFNRVLIMWETAYT